MLALGMSDGAIATAQGTSVRTVQRRVAEAMEHYRVGSRFELGVAWAALAEDAERNGADDVTAYAYARVGYHRSLDLLRRNGWKGHGPVPWSHEPNRGFLRALAALARAAERIGETGEAQRCADFLRDSSPEAADALGA